VPQYSITISPHAKSDIDSLDKPIKRRVGAAIETLADNPHPTGSKKLQGKDDTWRIRVGDYRILYDIKNKELVILVVKVGHRREVYR
jgi:mRNA interferase RelE/StbE